MIEKTVISLTLSFIILSDIIILVIGMNPKVKPIIKKIAILTAIFISLLSIFVLVFYAF
ncbi:hypothetical protein [Streptococcus ovis]|uniref:hypothetical protein n=1 Tax=Streptococcus ovis TaxID=82806 RepID=UPI0014614AF5|nr:hypothetical protein [Streptococcus ovis]